jgi:hypothetical protein
MTVADIKALIEARDGETSVLSDVSRLLGVAIAGFASSSVHSGG